VSEISAETGLTRQTVYRIKDKAGEAEKASALWGL
jgi:predicted transcriptional regulator